MSDGRDAGGRRRRRDIAEKETEAQGTAAAPPPPKPLRPRSPTTPEADEAASFLFSAAADQPQQPPAQTVAAAASAPAVVFAVDCGGWSLQTLAVLVGRAAQRLKNELLAEDEDSRTRRKWCAAWCDRRARPPVLADYSLRASPHSRSTAYRTRLLVVVDVVLGQGERRRRASIVPGTNLLQLLLGVRDPGVAVLY